MQCSVDFMPFLTAHVATPCGHSFNEASCVKLFGRIVNGACKTQNVPCPICRTIVTSYIPNYNLRSLVAEILQQPAAAEPPHKRQRAEPQQLPERPPEVVVAPPPNVPVYPGPASHFIHNSGDWHHSNSGAPLCKELRFKSQNPDALINEFELLGYNNGAIKLFIQFTRNHVGLASYLRHHGIIVNGSTGLTDCYYAETPIQVKTLFNILATQNHIPQAQYDLMRPIVEGLA